MRSAIHLCGTRPSSARSGSPFVPLSAPARSLQGRSITALRLDATRLSRHLLTHVPRQPLRSDLRARHEHHSRLWLQAGRHRLRPCRTGLPPSSGHAPGGQRRSLRDRRSPPSASLELHMDKTGRDGNSGLRRRQARCRAMRSSNLGRHSRHNTTPYAQRVPFVPPCFRLPRQARPPPALRHKRSLLALRPSNRNAVCNGQFTATARSREPAIQHGYPHSASLRSLRPDTPCAFEGHTARQASTHRCRATRDLTALRMSGRPARSSSAVHPVTAALRALREPRRIDRGRQRRHHAGVRASPQRHGSSRWLAAYGGPASRTGTDRLPCGSDTGLRIHFRASPSGHSKRLT